jgi:hypothetical protein
MCRLRRILMLMSPQHQAMMRMRTATASNEILYEFPVSTALF